MLQRPFVPRVRKSTEPLPCQCRPTMLNRFAEPAFVRSETSFAATERSAPNADAGRASATSAASSAFMGGECLTTEAETALLPQA
jgi:hypothetical protein